MQVKNQIFCQECTKVFHDNYDILNVLGNGSFGVVFHSQRKRDEQQFAVKRVDLDAATLPLAAREVNNISSIGRHPGYIIFEEVFWNEHHTEPAGHLYIVMELCEQITLREWLKESNTAQSRPWNLIKDWIKQLACALDHLHQKGFIHRDLKPANVFFAIGMDLKKLKIGDFGLAVRAMQNGGLKNEETEQNHTAGAGTPYYMAPEQTSKVYDEKVDIFALGLISAELIILDSPTQGFCTNDIIRSGQWPREWMDYPDALQFLSELTSLNPVERPTAAQILIHPFIQ
ncbi:hypothetical protein GCK72_007162 [Caenorhabditis remanei]|uniref:Protein kinase domain-containing protein n=1 Tax=Caenorhabditis remanei TaxID=31234 RepID=A0A6A5HLE6_CAERE|nr:hypothetical protein GCK72_007162 [Caenorhabditis remanei]KAF1767203.1 hypothetical protein GCK72_007162 [Caenorhabditis remanei]